MTRRAGFEYRGSEKDGRTPFEIFLQYTDEKNKSASMLGTILSRLLRKNGMTLLDIGSGNGAYLRAALEKMKSLKKVIITLLEPSDDLVRQLRNTAKLFPHNTVAKVTHSSFEDFMTDERFDIVLASHVPLAKDDPTRLPAIYSRMLELLEPNGRLIVVLRGRDDIHWFRTTFKSQIMDRDYASLTIDDAERVFKQIAGQLPLRLKKFSAQANAFLPYPDNMEDVITIVEFLLNTEWEEIPAEIRDSVLKYIRNKHGRLRQVDGILVAKKIRHQKKRYPPDFHFV